MSGFIPRVLAAAIVAAVLPACGGGGSGSNVGGPPPTAAPTSQASATPTPGPPPTTTPTPAALQYTGRVVDADHGNAPVAGAAVSVGTSFGYVAGSGYVLGGITANTATIADGSFTISGSGSPLYIQIVHAGLISAHRPLPAAPITGLKMLALPTAMIDESAGLSELNVNRAKFGFGQGTQPLTMDADIVLAARAHAQDEALRGYFSHVAPGTNVSFSVAYVDSLGGFNANPLFIQENLAEAPGTSGTLSIANDSYIGAGPNDGHYQNVISKTSLWVGFGEAFGGKPDPGSSGNATESYFVENYIMSTANPAP
ncbi:MAG: hypothetical protein M3N13_05840 [Candidatus Eremiobacteraeota bacterium]|nr:hypothetical protein [Candidatus Eremiobacteraeota bacterium]